MAQFNLTDYNLVRNLIVSGTNLLKDESGSRVDALKFRQAIKCLMYLTVTHPDLMFRVSLISRFMTDPKESIWPTIKKILQYVKGTVEHRIFYKSEGKHTSLIAYTDNNYAGDLDDCRNTSGLVLMMGRPFNLAFLTWFGSDL